MLDPTVQPVAEAPTPGPDRSADSEIDSREAELIEGDLLVEDVSIDGMCGVY